MTGLATSPGGTEGTAPSQWRACSSSSSSPLGVVIQNVGESKVRVASGDRREPARGSRGEKVVAEPAPLGPRREDVGLLASAQSRLHLVLTDPASSGDRRERRRPPRDREHRQDTGGGLPEAVDGPVEQLVGGQREPTPRSCEKLPHEQRVAAGHLVERRCLLGCQGLAVDLCSDGRDVVGSQAAQADHLGPHHQPGQGRAAGFAGPHRGEHEDGSTNEPLADDLEEVQGRLVGPVQVLEHEEPPPAGRERFAHDGRQLVDLVGHTDACIGMGQVDVEVAKDASPERKPGGVALVRRAA